MKKLYIDYGLIYNKLAYYENEVLSDLYLENKNNKSLVGNIYIGKIVKLLKPIRGAFVDIGLESYGYINYDEEMVLNSEILVQVKKDKTEEKGVFLSKDISISNKGVVVLFNEKGIKFSKEIKDKEYMKYIQNELRDFTEYGIIIRTHADEYGVDTLKNQIECLSDKYTEIKRKLNDYNNDRLLFSVSTFDRCITKYIHNDVSIVSNVSYKELLSKLNISDLKNDFIKEHYNFEEDDIFDIYGINKEISLLLKEEILLDNGIKLIINELKTMTVIDVNSGNYVKKLNSEDMYLKVNLEAAKDIARLLRLRNISGIIIVDFINMSSDKNKDILIEKLKCLLNKDKNRPKVHSITMLGLVEITRSKRTLSLQDNIYEYYFEKVYYRLKTLKKHTGITDYKLALNANNKIEFIENGYKERIEDILDIKVKLIENNLINDNIIIEY